MKNLLYLFLIGILFSCGGTGGSEEPNLEEPGTEPKEYIVSLGMVGEIEISESPLGRATPNDLYGIQVYSKTATTEYYTPYAYGLFDNKSKMTIKLLEGYQYMFCGTMVVDGKNKIFKNEQGYFEPFTTLSGATLLSNAFILSSNQLNSFNGGYSAIFNKNEPYRPLFLNIPNLDRYYGEIKDYVPTENCNVSINMKRVVFGAKFIAEGLTEGRLIIKISDAPELYIEYGKTTEVEDIFTFKYIHIAYADWTLDDFSETYQVTVSWEKADGAVVPLVNQDITFKRKILSTITIKVKDTSINNGVEINQEAGDLIPGDDITLESGTGIDKPVEPNV